MTDIDVLVIGAGAAGVAAARHMHDAGHRVLILEARNRIGGRMWTDPTFAGFPLELGAEFIHGERAVTHDLAHAAGLTPLPVPRYPRLRWSEGGPAQPLDRLSPFARQTIERLFDQYKALPRRLRPGEDCSLADYLRQQGNDAQALAIADVLLAQTGCASIETLSCADLVCEMAVDHAGRDEFYLEEGYAALLAWYSHGLPIRLKTAVELLQWGMDGVIAYHAGGQYRARRCLITLPVSLLQAGRLRFDPPLSRAKQEAINAFRFEPATKLIYKFRHHLWDDELVYMAHTGSIARWWTPAYREGLSGRSHPTITAFVTAERALRVDRLPEG